MTRLTASQAQALLGQPRRSKMGNKPVWECQECLSFSQIKEGFACKCGEMDLWRYASMREFNRWHELKVLEQAGQIRNLRRQVSYRLEVNGKLICRYVADAVYDEIKSSGSRQTTTNYWSCVVEDSKGHATAVYKLKAKLMAAGACPEFPEGILIRET